MQSTTSGVLAAMQAETRARAKYFLAAARWLDVDEMQLTVEQFAQEYFAAKKKVKECAQEWTAERLCLHKRKKRKREHKHAPKEIGSQDEESEHAREEIASLSDVITHLVLNVVSDLAINEPQILQDLRDHQDEQYIENVRIARIREKWASQGNENEWFHLWQRAEEPTVERLLFMAAKAATKNATNEL